ncbi:tetratricopeptide repeat protein [Oscillatoriales cyanobacterium LEGE 11467]|uniref:Tetratricopeptide repeat protein n=1 Tax=Zarconia navalis LEGE 11467 TaxID=1828826 RepID=A0A928Z9E2_9CYAN|nr:tetratricopeptide repeat protein [Zarconia navalis]MBE9042565.1 tetratricopeptide repeat protein [Zarconia navalis LEGE 11467]
MKPVFFGSKLLALVLGTLISQPAWAQDSIVLLQAVSQLTRDYDYLIDVCYESQGREALEACDLALEIKPEDATTWTNRGTKLDELGQLRAALASHDRAIELTSNYSLAWANRCSVLIGLGRNPEAVESCQAAIRGDGRWGGMGEVLAWYNLGVALHYLERNEEALTAYNRAIELKPNDADIWNNLGLVLEGLGRLEDAMEAYQRAVSLDPTHSLGRSNINLLQPRLD